MRRGPSVSTLSTGPLRVISMPLSLPVLPAFPTLDVTDSRKGEAFFVALGAASGAATTPSDGAAAVSDAAAGADD